MQKEFNFAISIIRVAAMISIIVGHWLTMQGINHYQFGAIGVEIFFFISGYLYSKKNITNIRIWIKSRWKRIIFPYWIVLGAVILLRLCLGYTVTFEAILVFFFNLQGVDRVFRNITMPVLKGMGQTWFLTVLMMCYAIMLILKKNPKIENMIRKNIRIALFCTIFLQILLSFIGIQISRPLCFFYGYFWDKPSLNISIKKYSLLTVLMVLLTALRFLTHMLWDGTIFYDGIVFAWSFVVLAFWLIISANKILNCVPVIVSKVVSSKAWKLLDLMTYPLFLTHYMYASGEIAVINWVDSRLCQVIVFVTLTTVSAGIVLFITSYKKEKDIIKAV